VSQSSPLLLALDTSTSTASVAVFDGERVLSETTWLAGREHSTRVLVEVEIALERIGRVPEDVTGLVVACGPGSFTGVRVALSVAKGIAAGLGIPVWGVNSLDVVAFAAEPAELPVRAVLEAGRGRFATALYRDEARIDPARLAKVDELCGLVTEPTLVIGEVNAAVRDQLRHVSAIRLAPAAAGARRAGFLAELGWRLAQSGEPGDARSLDAIYIS
jgi:tRNA threonylcarbamoyladenosine biosynthesis protein TsaB